MGQGVRWHSRDGALGLKHLQILQSMKVLGIFLANVVMAAVHLIKAGTMVGIIMHLRQRKALIALLDGRGVGAQLIVVGPADGSGGEAFWLLREDEARGQTGGPGHR